jgi:hypothetical protein
MVIPNALAMPVLKTIPAPLLENPSMKPVPLLENFPVQKKLGLGPSDGGCFGIAPNLPGPKNEKISVQIINV